jgi:ParB-like chromosome segregation protein Spo0J
MKTENVPLDDIIVDDSWNLRLDSDPALSGAETAQLQASVRANGVLEAVHVCPGTHGKFHLIAGFRRVKAAKAVGLSYIPAEIHDRGTGKDGLPIIDGRANRAVNMIENLAREDFRPVELARGLAEWSASLPPHGRVEATSKQFGLQPKYTARLLRTWSKGSAALIEHWQKFPQLPLNKVEAVLTEPKEKQLAALLALLKPEKKASGKAISSEDNGKEREKVALSLRVAPNAKNPMWRSGVQFVWFRVFGEPFVWSLPSKPAAKRNPTKKSAKKGGKR